MRIFSAQIGTNSFAHAYDFIGNQTNFIANAVTNTYTHNALNQIETATIPQFSILNSPLSISHDLDGNITNDSVFAYSYDAANRLSTVTSNGIVVVANQYDYNGRRIRKATPTTETTFVYDGWNLIHETVNTANGSTTNTTEIQYFWGADHSETLQGAGGVGGLLAVSINANFYFPAYDNNGNITKYIDESGNVVAAYEYDAFGKTISQLGPMGDAFRIKFSTKYYDSETRLYYYGYRFYSPTLMRWINRDPMGEDGGNMLYGMCANNLMIRIDALGLYELTLISDKTIEGDILMWFLHGNAGSVIRSNIHSQNQLLEEIRRENSKHGSMVTVLNISGHGLIDGSGILFADNSEFDVGKSYKSLKPVLARNATIKIWSCDAASTYRKCSDLRSAAEVLEATIYANTGEVMSGPNGNALSRLSQRVVAWVTGEKLGEWKIFTPRPKMNSKGFTPGPRAFRILKEERKLND